MSFIKIVAVLVAIYLEACLSYSKENQTFPRKDQVIKVDSSHHGSLIVEDTLEILDLSEELD